MFEGDVATLSTADLLASAAEHHAEANRVAARGLEHAQVYADRHHPSACPDRPGRRSWEGRERTVVLGGDGCPEVVEFAIAEFAVLTGVSPRVAAGYLGQALALRHRFPFTWARVQAGEATAWKAGRIAADCAGLSEEAAAYVDRRVAPLVDSITPYRLQRIVTAAKLHADPDLARAQAAEKAGERGVFVGRSTEHGTKTMYIRAAAGAVIRHDAALAAIAAALKTFGDTRPVQHRRADAVGILADPRYTEELLTQARHNHPHTPPTPATTDAPHPTAPNGKAPDAAPDAGTPSPTAPTAQGVTAPDPGRPEADDLGSHSTSHDTAPPRGSIDSLAEPDHLAEPGHLSDPTGPAESAGRGPAAGDPGPGSGAWWGDEALLAERASGWGEPGPDDEADREAPHPSASDLPDPLDTVPIQPFDPYDPYDLPTDPHNDGDADDAGDGEPPDAAAQRALHARLARIKHDAYTHPTGTDHTGGGSGRLRPGQTDIYVHLTDHTLATGTGVLRAEGIGPLLADQLAELVGHGPYTVKPVIDLNDAVSVDAYEIPDRIRERVKLTHPVELFPYGTQETHRGMDLDHLQPYDPLGPPGQTTTRNLAPLGRFNHRVKTHAPGWTVHRLDHKTLEWTTPHGFTFHVTPTGTHRVQAPRDAPDSS